MSKWDGRQVTNADSTQPGRAARPDGELTRSLSAGQIRERVLSAVCGDQEQGYHVCVRIRLKGPFSHESLRTAWDQLLARHEILLAEFQDIDSYVIHPHGTVPLPVAYEVATHGSFESILRLGESRPFDLARAPLVRLKVVRLSDADHLLSLTAHPLVADRRSVDLMLGELSKLYNATCRAALPERLEPVVQYDAFVTKQQSLMESGAVEADLGYWRRKLNSPIPLLDLPTDYSRPPVQSFRAAQVRLSLDEGYIEKLNKFACTHRVSQTAVLCAGWALCLSRLTAQRELIVGVPADYRKYVASEYMIGPLENSVPLRIRVDLDQPLLEMIAQVDSLILEAEKHGGVAFQQIMDALGLSIDPSRHPLYQTQIRVRSLPDNELEFMGVRTAVEDRSSEPPLFDLSLSILFNQEMLNAELNYDPALFREATIETWGRYLTHVLQKMLSASPEQKVRELSLLTSEELQNVLHQFNATDASYPRESLIHELFDNHAENSRDAVAIVHGKYSLTYTGLREITNRMARELMIRGVSSGDYVPLLMPRSLEMICAQLAVLKCAAAYVPLDPALPANRRTLIIKDCGARSGVYCGSGPPDPQDELFQWFDYDEILSASPAASACRSSTARQPSNSPAYVMYTSGSTGIPKGVMVPHRAVIRLVINCGYVTLGAADRIAHCSNPSFDAATFEVWGALLNGGSVVVIPPRVVLDPAQLSKIGKETGITVMVLTTALFQQHAVSDPQTFSGLRALLFGGEAADARIVRGLLNNRDSLQLINVYGPTETTTFATSFTVEHLARDATSVPIGRPISNTRVYVLDSLLQPTPPGVIGEIYIGGPGVSLGYLNRPALTAECFIADPFSADSDGRLYRSRDLGRWLDGRILEFRGRNDHQVKIRGFRIELGEIEAQISTDAAVREVAVLARDDVRGEKLLVAYMTTVDGRAEALNLDRLRRRLKEVLAEYMVPAAFVVLPQFPLTVNGKLDRRALPLPTADDYQGAQYEPPQGVVEEYLCEVWQELLGVDRVGRWDNFFHVGGNSIQGMKLSVKVAERFNVRIPTYAVFQAQVLSEMAEVVDQARQASPSQTAVSTELEFD